MRPAVVPLCFQTVSQEILRAVPNYKAAVPQLVTFAFLVVYCGKGKEFN